MDGQRPTRAWLTARVVTLLAHFYQRDLADPIMEAMVEDWKNALGDLPAEAVQMAIRARLASTDRRTPIPGEIRAAALSFCHSEPPRMVVDNDAPYSREVDIVKADRAAELARDVFGDDVPPHIQNMVDVIGEREGNGDG